MQSFKQMDPKQKNIIIITVGVVLLAIIVLVMFLLLKPSMPNNGGTGSQNQQLADYKTVDDICPYVDIKPLEPIATEVKSKKPAKNDSLNYIECKITLKAKANPNGSERDEPSDYILTVQAGFSGKNESELETKRQSWEAIWKRQSVADAKRLDYVDFGEMQDLGEDAFFKRTNLGSTASAALRYQENMRQKNMHMSVELQGVIEGNKDQITGKEFDKYVHEILLNTLKNIEE